MHGIDAMQADARRTLALLAVLVLLPAATQAKPIGPGDFGPDAEVIDFDDLERGTELGTHLRLRGVLPDTSDTSPLVVSDAGDLQGNAPHSSPHAVRIVSPGAALRLEFLTPRAKLGLYLGHLAHAATATLRAFDATGQQLDAVQTVIPKGAAYDVTAFVGLAVPNTGITSALLEVDDPSAAFAVDDLVLEPSQEVSVSVDEFGQSLRSSNSSSSQKLDAISALVRTPSRASSAALQAAATSTPDPYVRERAILGLAQLADPAAIPVLAAIGGEAANDEVAMAAYQGVWALRQLFPIPDPPQVTLTALGPALPGVEFEIEARVTSPVARGNVKMWLGTRKGLEQHPGSLPDRYEGPLAANQEVVLRAVYMAEEEGFASVPLHIRGGDDPVDALEHDAELHVRIGADGGETRSHPFDDPMAQDEHVLVME